MNDWQRDDKASAAKSNSWVIALPSSLRTNESGLRNAAANLLDLPHVRSVIVDGGRSQAVVRFHSKQSSAPDVSAIPALASTQPLPACDSTPAHKMPVVTWIDPRDQSLCFIKLPPRASGWRRGLLLIAAAGAILLGLLGVVLPGLPTTPFVLVASYCLLRSSPNLHEKLLHNRLLGGVLRDWHLHRGLRPHIRYKAIAVILLVVGASLFFTSLSIAPKLAILAIALCGIAYVWRLPDVTQ